MTFKCGTLQLIFSGERKQVRKANPSAAARRLCFEPVGDDEKNLRVHRKAGDAGRARLGRKVHFRKVPAGNAGIAGDVPGRQEGGGGVEELVQVGGGEDGSGGVQGSA